MRSLARARERKKMQFFFSFLLSFVEALSIYRMNIISVRMETLSSAHRDREMEEFRAPQSDPPLRGDSKAIDEALEGEPEESHG